MPMSYRLGVACAAALSLLSGVAAAPAGAAPVPATGASAVTQAVAEPHPELSGKRIQVPGTAPIYVVDPDGYRRHIPDPETYENLFTDWSSVLPDLHLSVVSQREALSHGAFLGKDPKRPEIYLISNNIKRWITSPDVMDKYGFDWSRVRDVPALALNAIPEGTPWT